MIVCKFGGTSLADATRIKDVANLITSGSSTIVVLSANAGTTDSLTKICDDLYKGNKSSIHDYLADLSRHYQQLITALYEDQGIRVKALEMLDHVLNTIRSFSLDMFTPFEEKGILAQGELLSTALMQFYLEQQGLSSVLLQALDFMRIDQQGEPDQWYIKSNLERLLSASPSDLYITQGFICRNHFGEIDNLKRGGSDYTASIIGACLKAEEIQIWTDIDGMHNNDPRIVKKTIPIERLTFDEAAELAYFGAKILHPTSVLPARKASIPVRLKNTLSPEKNGTIISETPSGNTIKAVAAKGDITAIKINSDRMLLAHGFLRKVFEVFERHTTPIDMITTSEVAVSLTIDNQDNLEAIVEELKRFGKVEVDQNQCIICVVGHLLQSEPGYAAQIMDSLKTIPLRMISYGGSKNNVSFLVDQSYKERALEALNHGLFNL